MNLMKTDNLSQNEKGKKPWTLKRVSSRFGFGYMLFFAAMAATALGVEGLLTPLRPYLGQEGVQMLVMLSGYLFSVPLCFLVVRNIPKGVFQKTDRPTVGSWLLTFVISMGFAYGGNLMGQLLMGIWGLVTGNWAQNSVVEMVETMSPVSVLLPAVLVGPVIEEFLFRKLLLDRIVSWGEARAILVSGILFGLAHGNFFQFFYAFFLGCLFAYVYLRTGKFWYVASFHMAVNFMGSVVPMCLFGLMERFSLVGTFVMAGFGMWMFGFLGCTAFLLIYLRKGFQCFPPAAQMPWGKWLLSVFANVGMGIFVCYCLASLGLSLAV